MFWKSISLLLNLSIHCELSQFGLPWLLDSSDGAISDGLKDLKTEENYLPSNRLNVPVKVGLVPIRHICLSWQQMV